MSNKREASLVIALGKKGVGKSYRTITDLQRVVVPNPRTGARPRKVLLLDVNNEFSNIKEDVNPNYFHAKALAVEDVAKWTHLARPEMRRIAPRKAGGRNMTLDEIAGALSTILDGFHNGTLLIEDPTKFISDSIPGDLIGKIISQRHSSCDIYLHFQTVGKITHPKIWGNVTWIRLHKTDDNFTKWASKLKVDITPYCIAETMIENRLKNGDKHFYVWIEKESSKVYGNFSEKEFKDALLEYLSKPMNSKKLNEELNRTDIYTGKKIYTDRKKAIDTIVGNYIREYYGNDTIKK